MKVSDFINLRIIHLLAFELGIEPIQLCYRLRSFEFYILKYSEHFGQDLSDFNIKLVDINIYYKLLVYIKNNDLTSKIVNNISLLEIIIIYYYMMDIIHGSLDTDDIGDYFDIPKLSYIYIDNIDLFSKPYHQSLKELDH